MRTSTSRITCHYTSCVQCDSPQLLFIHVNFILIHKHSSLQVNAALQYMNFSKKSKVPIWLKEIILSSSEDHLRKFLVFVTGSPSISSTSYRKVEINVRCQPRSGALPVAHTCFFHLGKERILFLLLYMQSFKGSKRVMHISKCSVLGV